MSTAAMASGENPAVVIVGAGPSGLATAASLTHHSIPHIILEREDCHASLWKKYTYDRLHLHLHKHFCVLPHKPFPPSYPTYLPKQHFITYLDDYVSHFNIRPTFSRCVELATYNEKENRWRVRARNLVSGETEEYSGRFLVVASGETADPFIPEIQGLDGFNGEVIMHSTQYRNGKAFCDKSVLVVGSGNSGWEIAQDLAEHGARTSMVVRSPVHILSRGLVYLGLNLLNYIPYKMVDSIMVILSKLKYGDTGKYGIRRPEEGPFFMKIAYGKYPVFDQGTYDKIKSGEIQVLPSIEKVQGNECLFKNGKKHPFDAIVFCTGFTRATNSWLKGDDYLLTEDGVAKQSFPNHWKGENGLYCCGLSRRGLYGLNLDALNIANHIKSLLINL